MPEVKEYLISIHETDCRILQRIALRIDLLRELRSSSRDFRYGSKENHVVRNHRVLIDLVRAFAREAGIESMIGKCNPRPAYERTEDPRDMMNNIHDNDHKMLQLLIKKMRS